MLDPLSITSATASLVFTIVKAGNDLATVLGEYQNAPRHVLLMSTECTVLAAGLSQVQMLFSSGKITSHARDLPSSLLETLNLSLVGCTLVLSVLTKEIDNLTAGNASDDTTIKKSKRIRYLWNEGTMKDLLDQLRGQSAALEFLLKALDSSSIDMILSILESGRLTFKKVEDDATSIRTAHPERKYAGSIVHLHLNDDTKSIYTLMGQDSDQKVIYTLMGQEANVSRNSSSISRYLPSKGKSSLLFQSPQAADNVQKCIGEKVNSVPTQPSTSRSEQLFVESLDVLRVEMNTPALAIGIVSAEVPSVYVRGFRKNSSPVPVTRVDRFNIPFAISEIMIKTVLAILIERSILSWTTTIVEALPDMAEGVHPDHRGLTVEMVCAHASSIRTKPWDVDDGTLWDNMKRSTGSAVRNRITAARKILAMAPDDLQATDPSWNASNLLLIAVVMESRTSRAIQTLLKQELFDPLEMYSTSVSVGTAKKGGTGEMPVEPWGHLIARGGQQIVPQQPTSWMNEILSAFHNLWFICSSMLDTIAFLRLHVRGNQGLSTPLLSFASFEKLHARLYGQYTPGGWNTRDLSCSSELEASGGHGGWSALTVMSSDKSEAYICLANRDFPSNETINSMMEIVELCKERSSLDTPDPVTMRDSASSINTELSETNSESIAVLSDYPYLVPDLALGRLHLDATSFAPEGFA